jgi:NADPH:quinone reductase-like Zn-dependent oxidoreductase
MKAARLHEVGTSLKIEEVAAPSLKPGGAIVKILASHVPNFMSRIVSGKLDYYVMPLPFIPGTGAIGIIEAIASLFSLALLTGISFARFSHPTAKVIFSKFAVIAPHIDTLAIG